MLFKLLELNESDIMALSGFISYNIWFLYQQKEEVQKLINLIN